MTTSAMLYLQGCGSDNNDPIVTGNNTPPPINNNTGGGGVAVPTNVNLDAFVGTDYFFMHGSTSSDGSKFLITVNQNSPSGDSNLYIFDADSIAANTPALDPNVTNTGVVSGDGSGPLGSTITFRSAWTDDDSKIMLSGADRFYVLDAATLDVLNGIDGDTTIGGQNHDALPTDDGKYALLTLRTLPYVDDADTAVRGHKDGEIQLYDVDNGAPIGEPVSVCNSCHGDKREATLCGLDGELTLVPGTAPGYGGGEATPDTYEGTVYVAGHGGHFAKVDVTIDPSNTATPIVVSTSKIDITTPSNAVNGYFLHDARIDGNTLYWATYNKDENGNMHYGTLDLTTKLVTVDKTYGYDCDVTGGSVYCASGQTSTHYMPITMTTPGYVTSIPKATIATDEPTIEYCGSGVAGVTAATSFGLDSIVGEDYFFMHGSTNTARTKFLVTVNENATAGDSSLYILDADSVAAAAPAIANCDTTTAATVSGDGSGPQGATITFRSAWTPDDSKILLSGADRFYVINADTLAVENGTDGDTTIGGQNHDALSTSDGKYALLTLRTLRYADDADTAVQGNQDGALQLYDVVNGAPIGEPISVCNDCHGATDKRNAILCGLDGAVADDGDGTYSGTVYVAGHGGHFAKVVLTIDPSNTTAPIVVATSRINVTAPSNAANYRLHDARLDGDYLYWSTYMKDADGLLHYGSIDLANSNTVVDKTIAYGIDGSGTDVTGASVYCASGQTDTHHMPITMTTPGYITSIPKSTVQ
jgi:hypothetical protein